MRPLFEILGRWPAWEMAAVRHGLAAWVADELSASGRPVPDALNQAARAQLSSGLKLKRLTLSVLDAMAAVKVTPVLLKGFGLASRLFPEQPFARPASDVDVLVLPAALPLAEAALVRLGLTLGSVPGVADVFDEHHHRPWAGPAGLVELHFRLFSGFGGEGFDDWQVWQRCTPGTLEGRQVRWLSAEDEFLYLATHVANHAFLRVSWLVDLARYLTFAPQLSWTLMHERAQAAGFEVPFSTTLEVLARVLEVDLPPSARPASFGWRARGQLSKRIFSAERLLDARWSNDPFAAYLLRLHLVDSPRQGARFLLDGAKRYLRQRRGG